DSTSSRWADFSAVGRDGRVEPVTARRRAAPSAPAWELPWMRRRGRTGLRRAHIAHWDWFHYARELGRRRCVFGATPSVILPCHSSNMAGPGPLQLPEDCGGCDGAEVLPALWKVCNRRGEDHEFGD